MGAIESYSPLQMFSSEIVSHYGITQLPGEEEGLPEDEVTNARDWLEQMLSWCTSKTNINCLGVLNIDRR